eukprot:1100324-Lingulodinium_polyedra.AAC.1
MTLSERDFVGILPERPHGQGDGRVADLLQGGLAPFLVLARGHDKRNAQAYAQAVELRSGQHLFFDAPPSN